MRVYWTDDLPGPYLSINELLSKIDPALFEVLRDPPGPNTRVVQVHYGTQNGKEPPVRWGTETVHAEYAD